MSQIPPLVPMPARDAPEVLRIAHRGRAGGAALNAPEAAAYRAASLRRLADLGAHLVELDLRATRDGQLVVHHDPALMVDGRWGEIAATDLAELVRLAGGSGQPPTAVEVFADANRAGLGIYVDIKSLTAGAARRLVALAGSEAHANRVILASADPRIVALCAELAPRLPRAVLFRSRFTDPVRLAARARADFVHPCWEGQARPDRRVAGRWLARVRQHRLGVVCWHEERPDVIDGLLSLGVDGICTDDPALLTRLARETGRARDR